ncbi:rRNA biogenesis protein rrp36 [Penicillium argentinense]|uniref:rRNA biogenesis protein RRP36 n=1 Tax=Penicillium argentinense TaxID=1131581 RepID=A0A9W9G0F5_9EURO|nr:rRNA biogenesis protein rrp36 [Penicillium argentinense]KAJ5109819.1 rRNA biogenesis protein rrp36 [Penicillium argentinense]
MAISDMLSRRVRARPDDEEESVYSGESEVDNEVTQDDADEVESNAEDQQSPASQDSDTNEDDGVQEEGDSNPDDEDLSDVDDDNDNIQASLSSISFGALAKVQASMGSKKRKGNPSSKAPEESASPLDDIRARIREAREQKRETAAKAQGTKDATEKKAARANKHAPMVQSSKHAVSRKRTVVEPPAAAKARDPRFDAAVMGHSGSGRYSAVTDKKYAFLDEYRESELKELKAQLAKTKNYEQKEALKRQIRSATDQMKTRNNQKRERELIAEHKKREKQLIREGKKSNPYYLKKSDLKKQVLEKKYEEMGSRDRAKALERRRKKIASKERKDMPMERRGMGMNDGGPPADRGKRRRLA